MSDKKESDYLKLLKHLNVDPESFLMIGNSLKSDVIPVLNIGGFGIHVPYHTTWAHEHLENELIHERFLKLESLSEVLPHLK
jgi:putative hydrolase of the HAD superfamily